MDGFKHKTRIQIRFKDVDKMGHVNNANHITYFELARMAYFAEVVEGSIDWVRQGIILAHTEIDYKSPILLEDEVWVHSRVSRLGRSSFEVEYVITRTADGDTSVAAIGKSVQVCFDYTENKTIPVPQEWRDKVMEYEALKPAL
jgi:acyl-CoA thioester hydrolase